MGEFVSSLILAFDAVGKELETLHIEDPILAHEIEKKVNFVSG